MIELQGFMQLIECPTRITVESNTLIEVNLLSKISSNHDCFVCAQKINHKKTPPREIKWRNNRHYDPIAFDND